LRDLLPPERKNVLLAPGTRRAALVITKEDELHRLVLCLIPWLGRARLTGPSHDSILMEVHMSFWSNADLAFQHKTEDAINEEIWTQSAKIHQEIGFRPTDLGPDRYGARQAMLDPNVLGPSADGLVLPWVPDILGSEWNHEKAVHVVGLAYAGFIEGISKRSFPFDDYLRASKGHWHGFADLYLGHVIDGDSAYYEPLAPILEAFGSRSRFSLFDLCRASLVRRGKGTAGRFDQPCSPSNKDPDSQQCVASYCERAESRRWTRDRLQQSRACLIVVLGTAAEHGLLNLFSSEHQAIWDSGSNKRRKPHYRSASPGWTVSYAGSHWTLGKRLESPTWWCVGSEMQKARWHVVPIYHPARREKDHLYERTVKLLRMARRDADANCLSAGV
jgi:uracil-DNA glycosylase